ncbi:uncharacterized protein LOC134540838 isoform X2 [Bacillus rossius redtenbacheri]|uniref:uncharacterized protein LOC134540838 isoform X2 n=1 Tax=Bacillus rossius redtenbacheri TaxID=93214 RepID=UPI002FDC938F
MQPRSRFLLSAAAALLCIGGSSSLKLPSYIPACARNDPQLNACMKKNAQIALPGIVKGDRKYRVPPLEPFFISQMVLDQEGQGGGPGFSLVLSDASLSGLSKASIEDIRADLDKYILELELFFPHLELQTKYKLSGRFQSFPINGEGPGNITMTNVKVNCKFDFKQEKRKDGLTYLIPNTPTLTFDIGGRLHLQLDNLIKGDKNLGWEDP